MSLIEDVRKNTQTPFFAAVGVTDLAVEKVRDARLQAEQNLADLRKELPATPADAQVRVEKAVEKAAVQVRDLPARALNEGIVVAGKVAEGYDALAVRGKKLVDRLRGQQATKDLIAQAEATVSLGKGAVTTAKKAVADVEKSAKATITTARHEAVKVAETIAHSVEDEAKVATDAVAASVKRTRTAAKRTSTTTRNAAKRTTAGAKTVRTSAAKTATATKKAAVKAADKVGD